MERSATRTGRPRLFIGSSHERKPLADAIQLNLDGEIDATVWNQGLFGLSRTLIESLDRISREFDFAALVVTPDDVVESRGARTPTARDNVILEVGLFMGRLGRDRTFLVCPRDQGVGLPSDLGGMTFAHYSSESNGTLQAMLGPACTRIKQAISESWNASREVQPVEKRSTRDCADFVPRPRRRISLGTASVNGPNTKMRIVDISVSGAFLATPGEISVDKLLDLELRLDDGTEVSLEARVVRVQYPAWERIGGVGVKFTSVAEASARALEAFVAGSDPAPGPTDLRPGPSSALATG